MATRSRRFQSEKHKHGALWWYLRAVVMVCACIGPTGIASGAEPHIHGVATLEMAASDTALQVLLRGPAQVFYGFEHEPVTPKQRAVIDAALTALQKPSDALFEFEPACVLEAASINARQASEASAAHHGHDHARHHHPANDRAHQEGASATSNAHREIEASYEYHCESGTPRILTVKGFARFDALKRINAMWITKDGASSAELNPQNTTVVLSRP